MQSGSGSGVRIYQQTGKTRLYCESERCQQKEQTIVERAGERFEQALAQLRAGLSKPRTTTRLEKVWRRIGRLRVKYPQAAPHYEISVRADEAGAKAVELSWQRQASDNSIPTHPGMYSLRVNLPDWDTLRCAAAAEHLRALDGLGSGISLA